MSLQTIDMVKMSNDALKTAFENLKKNFEMTSTRRILTGGVLIVSTTYLLKSWINQMRFYRNTKLSGPMAFPIVGNFLGLASKGLTQYYVYLARNYGKICVFFEGNTPIIVTSDPDFIKNITIKDFRYFSNRRVFDLIDYVEPFNLFLTNLKDEVWKSTRMMLSTTFTSGKMKKMTSTILDCCNVTDKHLEEIASKDGILDFQKLYGCFIVDVVCSCFFGVNVDTVNNPDHEVLRHIKKITSGNIADPKLIILFLFPKLAEILLRMNAISFSPKEAMTFMTQLIDQIVKERVSKKIVRQDFIQFMVDNAEELNEETVGQIINSDDNQKDFKKIKKKFDHNEILAHSLLFMIAGSDTTGSALTTVTYNLAMNPKYLDQLIEEIDTVLNKHNGEISYEAVNEMPFMDMVIEETQRMYSPAIADRVATQDYEYNGIKIKKGQIINISLNAMHNNEEYFPEPDKFIPERERNPNYFMPFGNGPRICIASRFALLEIKLLLTTILSKYKFEKCDKTVEKYKIASSGLPKSVEPIYLKIVKR